ncbi:MAG: hypothetical protein ACP5E3_15535, partial [Bacteroidales bacterium]
PVSLLFSPSKKRLVENLKLDTDIITFEPANYINPYINQEGLLDTLMFFTGPPGKILSKAEFLVRSVIHEHAGKYSFYFTKGMQEKFRDIFGYNQMKDQGLMYKIEKPSGNILYLDGHPYDIEALNTLLSDNQLPVPEPGFFSRKIIHDFLIESRMILLFGQNNEISLDSMNAKMESFMLDNTPLETGINIY